MTQPGLGAVHRFTARQREADLRLDDESSSKKSNDGVTAVVPGNPDKSALIERIVSKDPDEVMPKPKHGPPLPEAQIALIERWIAQGAEWQEHWAFVPPKETKIAELSDGNWPSAPLDRFILQRLDREVRRAHEDDVHPRLAHFSALDISILRFRGER